MKKHLQQSGLDDYVTDQIPEIVHDHDLGIDLDDQDQGIDHESEKGGTEVDHGVISHHLGDMKEDDLVQIHR